MEHISFEKILLYSANWMENNEVFNIEGHLATCERCNSIYIIMKSIEKPLSQAFEDAKATASCPEDWKIGALIQGEMSKEFSVKLSDHINACGHCIDRAANYYKALVGETKAVKTPEPWIEKATLSLSSGKIKAKSAIFQNAVDYIKNLIAGLSPLPAYATAAVAILILVFWNVIPKDENIVTIASSEKLAIRDSEVPSTFGFTGTGEVQEVKYMEVAYRNGMVVFKWKPIDRASGYKFILRDKEKIIYSGDTEADAKVVFEGTYLQKNTLYTWMISGKTEDGRYFEYTGEFVAVK